MKFTTLIPLYRNGENGQRGPRFWVQFGGATKEGTTQGTWEHEGIVYHDAETLVKQIGQQLGQIEMFFEVQYFDGVRFLKVN